MFLKDALEEARKCGLNYDEYECYTVDAYHRQDAEFSGYGRVLEYANELYNEVVSPYREVISYELLTAEEQTELFDYGYGAEFTEDTLYLLVDTDYGIVPPDDVWELAERGMFSVDTLSEVCHFYSKTAKFYRHNGALINSNYVPDRREGIERENKKEKMYQNKEIILDMFKPKEIHKDPALNKLYLYYEFGSHSFHRPIYEEDIEDNEEYKNLEIKTIENCFESKEENPECMYCERFCDYVIDQLLEAEFERKEIKIL